MLEGLWIEINRDNVYYAYEDENNYIDRDYVWDLTKPLDLFIDFNNSKSGKPMSIGAGQYINGQYHLGKTWIIPGMRTLDMMDEIANDGYLDKPFPLIRFFGDASGRHGDTRSNKPDWDLIENWISNHRPKHRPSLEFEIEVPAANPAIKARHNLINGLCRNDLKQSNLFIYKEAKDLGKGLRLTQLKKDSKLIENDSLREQHITTALGYYCYRNDILTRDIDTLVIS
jgi:hypothetical protein